MSNTQITSLGGLYETQITKIILPTTVTNISTMALSGNSNLTTIVNPTGREFNWGAAFDISCGNDGNTFVTGTCGSVEIVDCE